MSRAFSVGLLLVLLGALVAPAPASGEEQELAYSIKEARSYFAKVSLDEDVFENIPACDPETHKYECDYSRYNHKPNCPNKLEIGATGKAPEPKAPPEIEAEKGGAGDGAGGAPVPEQPAQSSPVRLNHYIVSGAVGHAPGLEEAQGFGAKQWVDLSGVREPEAFTLSNAFTNEPKWEERCYPKDQAEANDSYAHVMSRSRRSIETQHMSECNKRACTFEAPTPGTLGATAEKARMLLHLDEVDGKVVGRLSAVIEDLNYGDGALTVEYLHSYARFESDGTPLGLKWEVASTASGAKLGGQPITLPQGEMVSVPGFSVGIAAPYVEAPEDGKKLTIIAAGLTIAHEKQAVFFGGLETYAGFGETAGLPTFGPPTPTGGGGLGPSNLGGGGVDLGSGGLSLGSGGFAPIAGPTASDTEPPVAAGPESEILVYRVSTGIGAVPLIIVLTGVSLFLLWGRWLQRFPWGRRMYRLQPFKAIDWIYRAFVKT
jgi:hypothetical protein